MFYYLYELFPVPLNLFQYVTFRAGMGAVTAFILCVAFGRRLIAFLKKWEMCENTTKSDSAELNRLHSEKSGTPTMGGLLIVGGIAISCLLWGDLKNSFMQVGLLMMLFLGAVGFIDDYIKMRVPGKKGLVPKTKLSFQFAIAIMVGLVLYLNFKQIGHGLSLQVPFIRDKFLREMFGEIFADMGWLYIVLIVVVIVSTSNAVNLTDGLDGLATGCVSLAGLAFALLAYCASNAVVANYLYVHYIPRSHEMVIMSSALVGAALGFLWYNSKPAMVIMGDTGALPLGGVIGFVAVVIHQELLLFIVGGVFVAEALSVIIQVAGFRLFKRRVFRIAPLHHHFQFAGWNENHVVVRFWIAAVVLAIVGVVTLKIR